MLFLPFVLLTLSLRWVNFLTNLPNRTSLWFRSVAREMEGTVRMPPPTPKTPARKPLPAPIANIFAKFSPPEESRGVVSDDVIVPSWGISTGV